MVSTRFTGTLDQDTGAPGLEAYIARIAAVRAGGDGNRGDWGLGSRGVVDEDGGGGGGVGCLSAQGERDLARDAASSASARAALMEAHLGLVVSIVLRYMELGTPPERATRNSELGTPSPALLDELMAAGCAGLERAIETFDRSECIRLSTHASWWIKDAVRSALAIR